MCSTRCSTSLASLPTRTPPRTRSGTFSFSYQRVASLREGIGYEVLELAHLVATVGEAAIDVLALRPDLDLAAEMFREALEAVHRGGAEGEVDAREVGE